MRGTFHDQREVPFHGGFCRVAINARFGGGWCLYSTLYMHFPNVSLFCSSSVRFVLVSSGDLRYSGFIFLLLFGHSTLVSVTWTLHCTCKCRICIIS